MNDSRNQRQPKYEKYPIHAQPEEALQEAHGGAGRVLGGEKRRSGWPARTKRCGEDDLLLHGGHLVQGHVDGVGIVSKRYAKDNGAVEVFEIQVPEELCKYIVERGSIAVDGISLTVVAIQGQTLELVLIPETIQKTIANEWSSGKVVNIETDIIASYVEKMLRK